MAYNGKVLRTLDDMTEPDKALWMVPPKALTPPPKPSPTR